MPIIDARSLEDSRTDVNCDVCIVGGGAAGIYLGVRLTQMGLTVVILEAGGRVCTDGASLDIEPAFEGVPYSGATEGRAFGLGGSTARWGGLLVPHSERDFRQTQVHEFDPWRHIVAVVEQHSADVLTMLGLEPQPDRHSILQALLGDAVEVLHSRGLEVQMAEFLPFRRKNLSFLLKDATKRNEQLKVFLHSVAIEWQIAAGPEGASQLRTATARSGDKSVTVSARSFVLAAGAIESARMLLEMVRQAGWDPIRQGAAVGRYLGDHLSCNIADVLSIDSISVSKLFGRRFFRGQMLNFRFLERTAHEDSPRGFAHFIFESEDAGFQLAKKLLGGLQSRVLPKVSLAELTLGSTGLLKLGFMRVMRSRLYIDPKAPVHLQLDIEQQPNYNNGIRLSNRTDALGRPLLVIQWDIKPDDYEAIRTKAARMLAMWPGRQQAFPGLRPTQIGVVGQKPHDAYHPVGVCRMGTSKESVVDPELRVHGVANLAVLSTGVFPSAGTANPTFSMLCLGEALAVRLRKENRR